MEDTLKQWLKQLKLNESTISMILGVAVIAVIGILAYNYFSGITKPEDKITSEASQEYTLEITEEDGKFVPQGLPREHSVRAGEHLWAISELYYGSGYNWVDIVKANNLKNPGIIVAGQKLTIPRVEIKNVTKIITAADNNLESITTDAYTVLRNDSLWKIAVRAYGDGYMWQRIYNANRNLISNPNIIETGWILKIPR